MGHRHHVRDGDARACRQALLDLGRRDVDAGGLDDLLQPTVETERAGLVDRP
jgi:hypothetical protein